VTETEDQPVVTYSPTTRQKGFSFGGTSAAAYRGLFRQLISTQLKARYQFTSFGLGWAVINPILMMLVYAFVFGAVFGVDRASYKLFLLAGLIPWQGFSAGLSTAVRSFVGGSDLLRKVPFPSEILPLASAGTALFNTILVFAAYLVYMAIRGFPVLSNLHWVVLALLLEAVFLAGLSVLLATLNAFARDVEQIVTFGVAIWFFLTPIIYPLARLSDTQADLILFGNPMAVVVSTIQNALIRDQAPAFKPFLVASFLTAAVCLAAWQVFRRAQYELPKVA
jgi:lipopolysaccharide transport system permease protein